mgnify:CR=1 FL=1
MFDIYGGTAQLGSSHAPIFYTVQASSRTVILKRLVLLHFIMSVKFHAAVVRQYARLSGVAQGPRVASSTAGLASAVSVEWI